MASSTPINLTQAPSTTPVPSTPAPASPPPAKAHDRFFYFYGLWAVVAGVATLLLVVVILVIVVRTFVSSDAIALVGAVGSPVAAMVSAFFGISASATAQSQSSQTANAALSAVQASSNTALAAGLLADPTNEKTLTLLNSLLPQS